MNIQVVNPIKIEIEGREENKSTVAQFNFSTAKQFPQKHLFAEVSNGVESISVNHEMLLMANLCFHHF